MPAQTPRYGPQFDASVNRGVPPPEVTSGGGEPVDSRVSNVLGTIVDTQPQPFPTVPSSFDANHHYYPGLSRSYLGAAMVETPMHRQLQMSTEDIPSVQLTIRGAISPEVLARWQQSQVSGAMLQTGL